MAEGYAMSDKILRTIETIFRNDSELREFTIIPTEDNIKNKSPVLYEDHNMGLESWCVKHVYNYGCSILFDNRELLSSKKISHSKLENLNYLLIGVILINPDVGTFWNMKKELIELDILNVENELHFSKIVLTHKSKSNEAFSYRRWILKRILNKISINDMQTPITLLQDEISVIHWASERSPNNYHSWNHRIWCMENMACNIPNISDLIYSELNYSQEWINCHVSENAGYHYRQYLIKFVKEHKSMISLFESYYNFVIKQLDLINDGEYGNILMYLLGKQNKPRLLEETYSCINFICLLLYDLIIVVNKLNKLFPEHESLFYHRRFLVVHLLKIAHEYHGAEFQIRSTVIDSSINTINNKNIVNSDVVINIKSSNNDSECNQWPKLYKRPLNKIETCNLYKIVSNSEKEFVSENLSNNCSVVQIELTKRYQKWMKYVIGFE